MSKASSENHPHHVASPTRSQSPERIHRSKKGIRTSVGWPDLVKCVPSPSLPEFSCCEDMSFIADIGVALWHDQAGDDAVRDSRYTAVSSQDRP